MSFSREGVYENGKKYEVLSGKFGLEYYVDSNMAGLEVPMDILKTLGGRDVITKKLHQECFDGSNALGGRYSDDGSSYIVEFLPGTSREKIMDYMEKIAASYEDNKG